MVFQNVTRLKPTLNKENKILYQTIEET